VSAGLDVSAHVASYAFAGATPLAREAALDDGADGLERGGRIPPHHRLPLAAVLLERKVSLS
jgi:hypothetical protein